MATIAQMFCLFNVLLPPSTETVTLPLASFSSFLSLSGAVCLLLLSKPLGISVSVVTRGGVFAPHVMLTGTNVTLYTPQPWPSRLVPGFQHRESLWPSPRVPTPTLPGSLDLSQTVACNACGLVPQQVFTGSVIPYLKKKMGRGSRPELIKRAIG